MALIRDRYEPLHLVGHGAQGQVIKSLDHQHDRLVALKIRDATSAEERSELLQEARILLSLAPHPNLPLVREDFFDDNSYYVAMDWIEGVDLETLLKKEGTPGLSMSRVLPFLVALGDALTHLHSHETPVIHGDVKPANIILCPDGRIVVVDFGIAARRGSPSGTRRGTLWYTSPEVTAGAPLRPAADIYSAGATAFALLSGMPPAPGASLELPNMSRAEARRVLHILRRTLSYDPHRRPGTVTEFVSMLSGEGLDGPRAEWLLEERRLVSVLAIEVSDSSAEVEQPDLDELAEAIGPILGNLRDIGLQNGARVVPTGTRSLLCVFGAVVAHEDDASRALDAALEMHSKVTGTPMGINVPGLRFHLRIGINTGHVIATRSAPDSEADVSLLGETVDAAQTLQSGAAPGEILVSKSTQRLAEARFEFTEARSFFAGSRPAQSGAAILVGRRTMARPTASARTALVGRTTELQTLTRALDAVDQGRGAIVTISGEPGVGKTRLTSALLEFAEARGFQRLAVSAGSTGSQAYSLFASLLQVAAEAWQAQPVDESTTLNESFSAYLDGIGMAEEGRAFLPLLGLAEPYESEPEAFRESLRAALTTWLKRIATLSPLVIVFDDVHEADNSSLELLQEAVGLSGSNQILLCMSGRPDAAESLAGLAAVAPEQLRFALELSRLDRTSVGSILESVLGKELVEILLDPIYVRSGGNPLFVEELIRALEHDVYLSRVEGEWRLVKPLALDAVPLSLEALIAARIDALSSASATVLHIASVIGTVVSRALLQALLPHGIDLESAIDDLEATRILRWNIDDLDDSLLFSHPLIREVTYARLVRRHRRALHRQTAEAIESMYGSRGDLLDVLADHWYLADAGPKALEYLVLAAERAKHLYANAEATRHLIRAVDLVRRSGELTNHLPTLLMDLADLHDLAGDYDKAHELLDETMRSTGSPRARASLASILRKKGEYSHAISIIDEALDRAELAPADEGALWLERGWSLSTEGRFTEALRSLEQGLGAVGGDGGALTGHLLVQMSRAFLLHGRLDDAVDRAEQAARVFDAIPDLKGLATALRILGDGYAGLGRLERATEALAQGLAAAERVGKVEEIAGCRLNLGLVRFNQGHLEEAIDLTRNALAAFERIGHASGRAIGHANLAFMLADAEAYEEAIECAERAIAIAAPAGMNVTHADALQALATIHLRQGRYSDAERRAEEALGLFEEAGSSREIAECSALLTSARALRRSSDPSASPGVND